jgi:hypothetical protein
VRQYAPMRVRSDLLEHGGLGVFGRPGHKYTGVTYEGGMAVAPGRADIEMGPYGVRVRPRYGLRRFLNPRDY